MGKVRLSSLILTHPTSWAERQNDVISQKRLSGSDAPCAARRFAPEFAKLAEKRRLSGPRGATARPRRPTRYGRFSDRAAEVARAC